MTHDLDVERVTGAAPEEPQGNASFWLGAFDRAKAENARLKAQLSDALKRVDELNASLLSALNKVGR